MMGYYNPIYSRGVERFLVEAMAAGIDGLIVVDLPPEEDAELCLPAQAAGLNFIRLATPTTDAKRLPKVLQNTSGFVYYVSITGITGAAAAAGRRTWRRRWRGSRRSTDLPVIVGFGITTPEAAQAIAERGGWLRGGVGHRQGDRGGQVCGRGSGLCEGAGRGRASGVRQENVAQCDGKRAS